MKKSVFVFSCHCGKEALSIQHFFLQMLPTIGSTSFVETAKISIVLSVRKFNLVKRFWFWN
jgi:hypothetical protein